MALLDSEIARVKAELGYNLLSNGASPWIDNVFIFEQVIQPNLTGGASTTSSTAIPEVSQPTPRALTLASATGFAAGARIVVDVDARQEIATAQSLSGAVVTVLLSKPHSGTYPVTVEGPETIVREILVRIRETKDKLASQYGSGALKQVDEIHFYDARGQTAFGVLGANLSYWREQLAAALGIRSAWSAKAAAGSTLSVY